MSNQKFDENQIKRLAKLLHDSDLTEIECEAEGVRIRVSRGGQPMSYVQAPAALPAPANTVPAAPAAPLNTTDHPGAVKSPMVGTAYSSPKPGDPAFVKVGDMVKTGQTLLIVEAMKVMNPIPAPKGGTVKEILFKEGQPVEFGETLLIIE